jgi:hypothetical protein
MSQSIACTQRDQFPRDLWPTKNVESMERMFLKYYQKLEARGAKGGSLGAEIGVRISPNVLVGII